MVDIGVGLLDENVADLFSRFQNITNETEAINTFSNVQASVDVLVVLGYKLNSINNDTTVDVSIIESLTIFFSNAVIGF